MTRGITYAAGLAAVLAAMAGVAVLSSGQREPAVLRVALNGGVTIRQGRRAIASMEPGLYEAVWRGASLSGSGTPDEPERGPLKGIIRAPGGAVVDVETRVQATQTGAALAYRLVPRQGIRLNSLHVTLDFPAEVLAGGGYTADGRTGSFPRQFGSVHLDAGTMRDLTLRPRSGLEIRLVFASPTPVLLQDNRQWGPTFSVRIGPQMDGTQVWAAGQALEAGFSLTSPGGVAVEQDRPVTLTAGADWVPLDVETEIQPGSALDFSKIVPWHVPAGSLGRIVATPDGHMAFASKPGAAVRFYGANLCFSAQYITHEQSDLLANRLRALGYNAVRFHHYESELVDRSAGNSVTLAKDKLDQLDYLFSALRKRGIYMTTDLFVSRPVFAAEVWPGETGDVGMDEFKMAVPVNDRAFANFRAFAVALLGHRNPYTGHTWAEDPALAWLSLINEGNPGNFVGDLTPRLKRDWVAAWNAWTKRTYPDESARSKALGEGVTPSGPFPPTAERARIVFNVFLADNQRSLLTRSRAFLRELRCPAQVTNMNAWTNPPQMQAVRTGFDYVDDHFYVDHPEFVERPWRLPSRCPNTSPVAQGAPGGRGCAALRIFDRPFTVSEYNYSGPGRFRGVGGLLTGALGAIQDWSVIWRFGYSHSRDNLFRPSPLGYFDLATDPLNLAAERASMCMFRRGDLLPARSAVAIEATEADLMGAPTSARSAVPGWHGLAWVTRIGYAGKQGKDAVPTLRLPLARANAGQVADPLGSDAGERILAELRRQGRLPQGNRTRLDGPVFQSDTGQLTVDGPADTLTIDTARTAGGYAPEGSSIRTGALDVTVTKTDATVWVSSLDDAPIATSKRLLITHLTDLQNTNIRYGDLDRRLLLDWGGLPHLVLNGTATVRIRMRNAGAARVWSLTTGGKRGDPITARVEAGALVVPLGVNATGRARILYEVEVAP
jgi:hypothetical protein